MAEYYIAPKSSFDATADAIREKTGSQATIEWTEDGFADAVDAIPTGGGGTDFLALRCNNDTPYSYFSEEVTNLSANSFRDAKQLTCLVLPNLETIQNTSYICAGCSNLEAMDLGPADALAAQFFYGDSALRTLILRKSLSLVGMRSTNTVQSSSMASGGAGCAIYIPKALYDHLGDGGSLDYKAATNWSTVNGYGTITWAQIEGSQYENYYADGTPIT